MKIAILDDYLNVALKLTDWVKLENENNITVFDYPFPNENEVASRLSEFEIIICMRERTPFPATLLAKLPSLKLLITTGMRNLSFDMEAAKAQGITVCGTSSIGQPTAELTWALILGLACNIPKNDNAMKSGKWQTCLNGDLHGKTLGVLGLGKLGGAVATVGKAFGMQVVAWSPNLTEERATEVGVRRVEKGVLMSQSDYISIHLILSDRSRGLVSADDLSLMKPSAYLVNTSRGPIVDTDALLNALRNKRIAGAGIDVYETEPLPADSPFRTLDNVLLTPHMGYVAKNNITHMYKQAAEDITAYLDSNPIRVLNR